MLDQSFQPRDSAQVSAPDARCGDPEAFNVCAVVDVAKILAALAGQNTRVISLKPSGYDAAYDAAAYWRVW
jgi:hypothetical protein